MRARYPDIEGFVERDGLKISYEVFGDGEPTVFLTPPRPIGHSRLWKAQVHYLARHGRVITADPLGNGQSDRPTDPASYAPDALAGDLVAVLDGAGAPSAVLVATCTSVWSSLVAAAQYPDRVQGLVLSNPVVPGLTPLLPARAVHSRQDELDTDEGWAKDNFHYWRRDFPGYLEFFFGELLSEDHSTKQHEDCVSWGLETVPEVLIAAVTAPGLPCSPADAEDILRRVRCPILVLVSEDDRYTPPEGGLQMAELTGGEVIVLAGAGHLSMAREPVVVNHTIREFAARVTAAPPAPRRWSRPMGGRRRALFVCSPIGLEHARRDLAIAAELRAIHAELEIDWLAQPPVAQMIAEGGERVHPASRWLAGESAHLESEAGEHDLRVFEAMRRMDEILVANFMVFDDVVRDARYDLCVADEGWEIDYFLHENAELKRSAYAWLTDFVGVLPMPAGGAAEAALTADRNAEMIEHIARLPRIRDRAIFVGDPEDVVPDPFGPGLPSIRAWTNAHFDFAGFVTGATPPADRAALREELGYRPDERVCLVTVGGTAVGSHLLRRAVTAYPAAARAVPGCG